MSVCGPANHIYVLAGSAGGRPTFCGKGIAGLPQWALDSATINCSISPPQFHPRGSYAMRLLTTAALSLTAATAFAAAGLAQPAPAPAARPAAAPAAGAKPAAPAKPAGPAWLSGCQAESRTGQLNCGMEQRLGVSQTGQQIAALIIQVPGATRQPNLVLQLPLGMNLTAGATLQIDANPALKVPIQACDQSGCIASMALPAATLGQMQVAKAMTLTVQGGNKPIKVPFQMTGFAQTYEKIK
jgi:invasion protein IalB